MWHAFADIWGLRPPSVRPNHLATSSRLRAPWDVPPPWAKVSGSGKVGERESFRHWIHDLRESESESKSKSESERERERASERERGRASERERETDRDRQND
jgi:hypothetical protein